MRKCKVTLLLFGMILTVFTLSAIADEAKSENGFQNESEAGLVTTSGNTQTESYNLQQQNAYNFEKNILKFKGRYLKSRAQGAETSKYWSLGLRYERELDEKFSVFLGYLIESDVYAGFDPRHNFDLGSKYNIVKNEKVIWLVELGYRFIQERQIQKFETKRSHLGRAYTEVLYNWTKTFSTKLWFEYLPNFTKKTDYYINSELSVSAVMSEVFSLKTAYLLRYRNTPASDKSVTTDKTFTTSIVAKF